MSPTQQVYRWSGGGLQPYHPDGVNRAPMDRITLAAGTYAQGSIVGEKYGTDELDSVTITGNPTGGTFTISVQLGTGTVRTTSAIPVNSSASVVQAAINALVNVAGDASVEDGQGNAYLIRFRGTHTAGSTIAVTSSGASLTGGSTPAATAAQIQVQAAGTPGVYGAYGAGNTDGTQDPTHILAYAVIVDGSGNVRFSDTAGASEHNHTELGVPAFYGGTFAIADLSGLDQTAIRKLGRRLNSTLFVMYS